MSLNWRLMMVPSALADYVVVHELCHSPAHGPFTALLGDGGRDVVPDYRERRRSLNALQGRLPL